MQQKEISRWLKAITIVLALMGAVFFLYIMPVLAMSWRDVDESLAYLFMPGLLYGWCIAVICYAILYQFWKVCVQIGKDNSFSKENAKCFRNISHFALLLAVVWFAGIVFLAILAVRQPGISIIINIDVMLAKRKMSVTELSEKVGITMANISVLKNGKAKAIKVDTLNKICRALGCQPGDILEYVPSDDEI